MGLLRVTVSAGARRPGLAGRHGEGWRVRVASPPERGRANEELLDLLARCLDLPRESVRIVKGKTFRAKLVEVTGLSEGEVERRLEEALHE